MNKTELIHKLIQTLDRIAARTSGAPAAQANASLLITRFNKAMNHPADAEILHQAGWAAQQTGLYEVGLDIFTYIHEHGLSHKDTHRGAVYCLLSLGRFSDAVTVALQFFQAPLPSAQPPARLPARAEAPPARLPSAAMQALTPLYQAMHAAQDPAQAPYDGVQGLVAHAGILRRLVEKFGLRDALDYGGGRGLGWSAGPVLAPDGTRHDRLVDFIGLETVQIYDPGAAPDAPPPQPRCRDAVLCLDVLERVPEEDVDWILAEIFASARKLVLMNIALYPAQKTFPDGRNVHITLKSPEWWVEKIQRAAEYFPDIRVASYFSDRLFGIQAAWTK